MLLLAAPAAASLVMFAAVTIERRLGPAAGGWTAALPLCLAVALFTVLQDRGVEAAAGVAWSAAGHMVAQVAFGVVLGAVLMRRSLAIGALSGAVAYGAMSLLVSLIPSGLAAGASAMVVIAAAVLVPVPATRSAGRRSAAASVAVCAGAAVIVAGTTIATREFGPEIGGAVGAFPTMCFALALVVTLSGGREDGVRVAFGLIRSLPCYLSFAATFALCAPHLGATAFAVAFVVAAGVAVATWWGMRPRPSRGAHVATVALPSTDAAVLTSGRA
ncbi:MAG: hypothetical protein L0G99_03775 [Propionibacteriales bacterium]|nr:hypothetical protein [Propionibacteriales bacterium]